MIIIGIDPGTLITGYGIIEWDGTTCRPIDYGCIRPPQALPLPDRYLIIFNAVEQLLERYTPESLVVETQYVGKNVQSAIKLGMARGVIILAARRKNIEIFEYEATKTKNSVVGNGKASKYQVQCMVKLLLNLEEIPTPEDAADALALAICHAQSLRYRRLYTQVT